MNKILSKPISFKLAKLAKEKGLLEDFEGVLNFYTKPKSKMFGIDEHSRYYPIINTPQKLYTTGEHAALNIESVYLAPTIAEMLDYIFEKYEIWIEVSLVDDSRNYHFNYTIIDSKNRDFNDEDFFDSAKITSSEEKYKGSEVYEVAIEYILLNLIE
jgi:hypothetical protein